VSRSGAEATMDNQIFCDGIGRISVIGGIVRLDLMAYSPTETDANGKPRAVLTHRIVMSVDAFQRSSEKVMDITRQLSAQAAPQAAAPVQPARPPEPPQFQNENHQPDPPPPPPPPRRPFP